MTTQIRTIGLFATLVLAVATGCTHPEPDTAPTMPAPASPAALMPRCLTNAPTVNEADAESVADTVALLLSCQDSRTDASPLDAYKRASPYLTHSLQPSEEAQVRGGAAWETLKTNDAYTAIAIEPLWGEAPPAAAADVAYADRQVTITPTSENGWTGTPVTAFYNFTLTKEDGTWRVSNIATMR
ncbi:hypothetical protein PWJ82_01550 [Actinotignum schaalii]|uniref:hypothetical protein n=1 Tax=Actinotignum TaxID=1653174 RepID=UPI00237D4327|nr:MULTISPECIES: hypothetical protein [Actinotignum]MDE1576987.1 hypothetical protein [Actinotignum sanguinis]MDE1653919.1 hypothetical protein [Actinotignum schaalii]